MFSQGGVEYLANTGRERPIFIEPISLHDKHHHPPRNEGKATRAALGWLLHSLAGRSERASWEGPVRIGFGLLQSAPPPVKATVTLVVRERAAKI
jgi:hypothetical protein